MAAGKSVLTAKQAARLAACSAWERTHGPFTVTDLCTVLRVVRVSVRRFLMVTRAAGYVERVPDTCPPQYRTTGLWRATLILTRAAPSDPRSGCAGCGVPLARLTRFRGRFYCRTCLVQA